MTPTARSSDQPAARTAAAALATAALVLLAAACGGGSSATGPAGSGGSASGGSSGSSGSSGSANARLVAYSQCIRSHGVPNYPDPAGGALPKGNAQQFGVSSAQFQAARGACQHLLPAVSGSLTANSLRQCYLTDDCPQGLVQQAMNAGRRFSQCMRSHGVPNWPDPTLDSQGRPLFNITVPRPAPGPIGTAINECSRLEPAGSLLAWG
jgi:hypothetical protein